MVGHPLDVEMFSASQWHMRERKEGTIFSSYRDSTSSMSPTSSVNSSESSGRSQYQDGETALELKVIKAFPFVHSLRRMSVIVKSSIDNSIHLFTKVRVRL